MRRAAWGRAEGRPTRRLGLGVVGGLATLAAAVSLAGTPVAPVARVAVVAASTTGLGTTTRIPAPVAPAPGVSPTTTPLTSPDQPTLTVGCPAPARGAGTWAADLSHEISAKGPYTVAIDYGDGHSFRGDDAHLTAVFTHTYTRAGSFTVTAVLTDASGRDAKGACSVSWSSRTSTPAATSTPSTHAAPARTPTPARPSTSTPTRASSGTHTAAPAPAPAAPATAAPTSAPSVAPEPVTTAAPTAGDDAGTGADQDNN